MMKKLTALCGALVLALSLSACGGTATQLPALVLEDPAASNAASQVSGTESGTQAEPTVEEVPYTEFEDSLDGLCDFLTANKAVAGEPTEMAYETIGAAGGYRYRFILNNSTVQVEVYAFDLENLGEQGQAVLDSVKESGQFPMLDNQVPATLSAPARKTPPRRTACWGCSRDFTANKREGPFSRTPRDCGACFFLCPGPCI